MITGPQLDVFEDFYQREHLPQVRRAFLLLGNSADAYDVVAEALAAVLQRWDEIESPGPYLNRCVLNGCRDSAKRSKRQRAEQLNRVPVTSSSELEAVELADLLMRLPFRQRAAIVMRYYGGHTETEIAETLQCRPGTVGPLIHRGLKTLRGAIS